MTCYKNNILVNETAELFVIVLLLRFICTVNSNVYNGSKFGLTPSVLSVKTHDPLDLYDASIFQSLKIKSLNKTDRVRRGPFSRNTGKF